MNGFNVIEFLNQSIIDGNIIKLPSEQLERKQYLEVKKKLELIGGKWKGGKTQGFVFEQNPSELLNQIINGKDIDLKKEYQFFETPELLANELVQYANIGMDDMILEPSAGRGAIINAINKHCPTTVDCYELMEVNRMILNKTNLNFNLIGHDFLKAPNGKYSRIIANPPFSKNQDIDHIYKMWELLDEGGKIVTMASMHWQISQNKKEKKFKKWLDSINSEVIKLPSSTFNGSGANTESCIIIIDKEESPINIKINSNSITTLEEFGVDK